MSKMLVTDFLHYLTLALFSPSQYATGAFGAPTGYKNNSERYAANSSASVAKKILACPPNTFMFDCIGLGKGILWGWRAKGDTRYGGAVYKSNDVPDISVKNIHKYCDDWNDDGCPESALTPGEWLRTAENDHVGYYVGDGYVIECTQKWQCKVQKTTLKDRDWLGHGKSVFIEYPVVKEIVCPCCGARFVQV